MPGSFASGPIRKEHWKPDAAVLECEFHECSVKFDVINRRHHCRICGGIFCSKHSDKKLALDARAVYNTAGTLHRVCDTCYLKETKSNRAVEQPNRSTAATSGNATDATRSPAEAHGSSSPHSTSPRATSPRSTSPQSELRGSKSPPVTS